MWRIHEAKYMKKQLVHHYTEKEETEFKMTEKNHMKYKATNIEPGRLHNILIV